MRAPSLTLRLSCLMRGTGTEMSTQSRVQCAETDADHAAAAGAAWSSGDTNYWGLRRKCGDDDGRLRLAPRATYLLVALAKVSFFF
jgi:hypothetical protein